jgi:hypothetical protein
MFNVHVQIKRVCTFFLATSSKLSATKLPPRAFAYGPTPKTREKATSVSAAQMGQVGSAAQHTPPSDVSYCLFKKRHARENGYSLS